jgi:hypothetical protein
MPFFTMICRSDICPVSRSVSPCSSVSMCCCSCLSASLRLDKSCLTSLSKALTRSFRTPYFSLSENWRCYRCSSCWQGDLYCNTVLKCHGQKSYCLPASLIPDQSITRSAFPSRLLTWLWHSLHTSNLLQQLRGGKTTAGLNFDSHVSRKMDSFGDLPRGE